MSDGRIVFDTAIDNSGAEKDISELRKDISDVIKNVEDSTVKSSKQLQQTISSACDKITAEAKELPIVMKEAAAEITDVTDDAATKSSDSTTEAAKKIRKESEITKDSVADDAEGMGKAHRDQAKKAESKWSAAFSKIKRGMQTCAKVGRTALKAVGVAAAAVVTVATLGVNYNNQMEAYNTSFKTMLGSAEAAYTMVADLKELAAETPLEMSTLASNAQTMLSFGISDKKTLTYLKQLGDVSQGDADKFSSLTLAFSQIQSAGKLTGQDLLQLINAGFNPLQILSEKTGKSMATLKKEMSEGKISAKMVAKAFEIATSEGGIFFKAMEAQSKTFSGRMSTLKDNALSFLGELTEGIQNELKDTLLPTVTDYLDQLQSAYTSGGLDALSKATGDVLSSAITEIASNTPVLIDTAVSVVTAFVQSLERNSDKVASAAIKIVRSLVNGLIKLVPEVEKAASKILSAFIREIFGEKAGNAVKKLTDSVRKSLDLIFKTVKKVVTWLKPVVKNVLSTIANMTKSTIPALTATLKILEPALWLVTKAFEGIAFVTDKVSGIFEGVSSSFEDVETESEKLNRKLKDSEDQWASYAEAAGLSIIESSSEADTLENLQNRLHDLVDEEGNLIGSKGELLRIIQALKDNGFNVEYDAVKNQIQNYQDLNDEISKSIELKRYQTRINALEQLANENEARMPELAASYAASIQEANTYIEGLVSNYSGVYSDEVLSNVLDIIKNAESAAEVLSELDSLGGDYSNIADEFDSYDRYLENYFELIETSKGFEKQFKQSENAVMKFNNALTLGSEGKYAEATKLMDEYFNSIEVISDDGIAYIDMSKDQLLNELEMLNAGLENAIDSGNFSLAETILEDINGAKLAAAENGYEIPEELAKSIESGEKKVEEAASNIADSCTENLDDVENDAYTKGKNSGSAFASGILSAKKAVINSVSNLANAAIGGFKKALKINSPSRVTREIGLYTGEGMNIGLKQSLKAAANTAYNQAANLVDKMRSAVNSRRAALVESIVGNTTNNTNTTNNYDERSFNQSFNFYSPNPTPSQTARAARLAMEVT